MVTLSIRLLARRVPIDFRIGTLCSAQNQLHKMCSAMSGQRFTGLCKVLTAGLDWDEEKMQPTALEYRARLLLERWKKQNQN